MSDSLLETGVHVFFVRQKWPHITYLKDVLIDEVCRRDYKMYQEYIRVRRPVSDHTYKLNE